MKKSPVNYLLSKYPKVIQGTDRDVPRGVEAARAAALGALEATGRGRSRAASRPLTADTTQVLVIEFYYILVRII